MSALLPLRQNERAHDGDQNQERSEFERVDEGGEEETGDLPGRSEAAGCFRIGNRAVPAHGGSEKSRERKSEREAAELGQLGEVGALFLPGVQEHDDENE